MGSLDKCQWGGLCRGGLLRFAQLAGLCFAAVCGVTLLPFPTVIPAQAGIQWLRLGAEVRIAAHKEMTGWRRCVWDGLPLAVWAEEGRCVRERDVNRDEINQPALMR